MRRRGARGLGEALHTNWFVSDALARPSKGPLPAPLPNAGSWSHYAGAATARAHCRKRDRIGELGTTCGVAEA